MSMIEGEPPMARININDAEDVLCSNCGGKIFQVVYLMKKLSAILSPTGKEELIPIGPPVTPPIFSCIKCGHINDEFKSFLPPSMKNTLAEKKENGIITSVLPTGE